MADEKLGLVVTADTSGFQAGFKQAETSVAALGAQGKKTGDEFDKMLEGWAKKAQIASQAVGKIFGGAGAGSTAGSGLTGMAKALDDVAKAQAKVSAGWVNFGAIGSAATGLNSFLDILGKIGSYAEKASELAHFSAEMENLKQHVPVEQLEQMRDATEGAVKASDLMRFSMKAMSGDLHVTKQGLDTVLRAANTLSDKGFGDTMVIADKLMDSLRKGSTRELKELGIALDDSADKMKNVSKEMAAFHKLADEDVYVNGTLKAIERAQTAWKDLEERAESGLGRLVGIMAQAIEELLGLAHPDAGTKMATHAFAASTEAAKAAGRRDAFSQAPDMNDPNNAANMMSDAARRAALTTRGQEQIDQLVTFSLDVADQVMRAKWEKKGADIAAAIARNKVDKPGPDVVGLIPTNGNGSRTPSDADLYGWARARAWELGQTEWGGNLARASRDTLAEENAKPLFPGLSGLYGQAAGGFGIVGGAQKGFDSESGYLQEQAQKVKDITDQLNDTSSAVGAAYSAIAAGTQAAVDAAISGSGNIAKAALKASAAALKAISVEAAGKAVFWSAEAILGNPLAGAKAAAYFAAAAAAGTGSALLGGLAGGGGGGGGGGASTPAGGGAIGPANSNAQQAPMQIIIQVGDGFVGKPDELAAVLMDKMNHATASGRGRIVTSAPGAVSFKQ